MRIQGYTLSSAKVAGMVLLIILTGGLAVILITWRKDIKTHFLYDEVRLGRATKILLTDNFKQVFEEEVVWIRERPSHFVNKKIKYIWDETIHAFTKLGNIDEGMKQADFLKLSGGLTKAQVVQRVKMYGENLIKISVPPVLYLVIHEGLNPFYLFQLYTVVLWSLQYYWKFAVIIAVTSVISVTVSVWETRRQNRKLRDTMKSESKVRVVRDNKEIVLSSVDLVPGDVILLPTTGGYTVECDSVLVDGSAVVNESMLTGESIPVTKVAIPDELNTDFNYDYQRQYIVFCGTEVMQGKAKAGNYIKAVVIRTGFMTTKGELVRAILFPPPLDFKFFSDFLKSVYVFLTLGLIGMAYSLTVWIQNGGSVAEIILNSLDILTFVVPPILPAALTANNAFAQRRLQKRGIFCLHTKHISLCGGIDVVAFDKTGTLTEGDLDLAGVCEIKANQFQESEPDPTRLPTDSALIQTMASCHSLIKMNGELTGYPMDIKLFEAIEWELKEESNPRLNPDYGIPTPTLVSPPKNTRNGNQLKLGGFAPSNLEIALLKQYPFDSAVQRMTVVAKKKGASAYSVFVKGAPEKVASLCTPHTIPSEFTRLLQYYTKQGFRVIGAASKQLKPGLQWNEVDSLSRSELETDSEFLGLIIMQNLVKKETYGAIKELHDADINTVMVTGDNILTAISVSRDCQLVKPEQTIIRVTVEESDGLKVSYSAPETETANIMHVDTSKMDAMGSSNYVFACDGPTFNKIMTKDPELFKRIVHRGKVFARMLPEQKIHLIEALKNMGRQVIMCGDGCNDCGALKTAHAGISLSMAEASVAAPFTSRNVDISCVPYLIREGRATMVSAFASFKFGVAFCFTQLISVLMVFYIGTEPSDNQYLVVDLGLAAVPIILIGNTAPHEKLVKQKPTRHLLSFLPMFSVISFLFFQIIAYLFIWFYVQSQDWFVKYEFVSDLWPPNSSYEQTNIFLYACAAAVIAAILFSKGAPYRKPLYTNGIMASWTLAAVSAVIFMSLYRSEDFSKRMNFKIAPHFEFQIVALVGIFVNFLFCYIWEIYILDGLMFKKVLPWYKSKVRGPNLEFEHLERELSSSCAWPPLGRNNHITDNYPGYPLPDVAVGLSNKKQLSEDSGSAHISRRDRFLQQSSKALLRRGSGDSEAQSELLRASFENPESTPVHITNNQYAENLAIHAAIDHMVRNQQPESNLLSDPLQFTSERMETVC